MVRAQTRWVFQGDQNGAKDKASKQRVMGKWGFPRLCGFCVAWKTSQTSRHELRGGTEK